MKSEQSTEQPSKEDMFDALVTCAMTLSDYDLVQFMGALGSRFDAGMFLQMRLCDGKSRKEALLLTLQYLHKEAKTLS